MLRLLTILVAPRHAGRHTTRFRESTLPVLRAVYRFATMLLTRGLAAALTIERAQSFSAAQTGGFTGGLILCHTHSALTAVTAPQMGALDRLLARCRSRHASPFHGFAAPLDEAGVRAKAIAFGGGRANSFSIAALALVGTLHRRESIRLGALGIDLPLWHGDGSCFGLTR